MLSDHSSRFAHSFTALLAAAGLISMLAACHDDSSVQGYGLGGSISGLTGSGLVLANGTHTLQLSSGASTFTIGTLFAGTPYDVTVQTQPSNQSCMVTGGSGTMGGATVSNISVVCAANTYSVGGTISGLSAGGLVLASGATTLAVNSGASNFTLLSGVASGTAYDVTVHTQPAGESCTVSGPMGTVGTENVNSVAVSCATWSSFTFSSLYQFQGPPNDGDQPLAAVVQGTDGNLYGTTYSGGANGAGAAFRLTPAGAETLLYSFGASGSDAQTPYAPLMQGSDGNFYGTTVTGGANGVGAVFKLTGGGQETVLYSFGSAPSDGQYPYDGLLQGQDGAFYGTTRLGGANNAGTVFKVTAAGVQTVLWSFGAGSDGMHPFASVIQDSSGNLYGTTLEGGAHGSGSVFKLTSNGTETLLYSFGAASGDAQGPTTPLIQASDGNFYGTTQSGGANGEGAVFKLTPAGDETVLYSFGASGDDGQNPQSGLLQAGDGNFYGATYSGGASGAGTVFRLTPDGTETVLHSFSGSDGGSPFGSLIYGGNGNFYGATQGGGNNGVGTVYQLSAQ